MRVIAPEIVKSVLNYTLKTDLIYMTVKKLSDDVKYIFVEVSYFGYRRKQFIALKLKRVRRT